MRLGKFSHVAMAEPAKPWTKTIARSVSGANAGKA